MNIEFKNGSTVSRMWGDLNEGEVLAAFQYEPDALLFANLRVQSDSFPSEAWLVVTHHLNGRVTVVRKPTLPLSTAA